MAILGVFTMNLGVSTFISSSRLVRWMVQLLGLLLIIAALVRS